MRARPDANLLADVILLTRGYLSTPRREKFNDKCTSQRMRSGIVTHSLSGKLSRLLILKITEPQR
jgi:hypothetical protein